MILHTGLRTDIPAFYAPWFANRLKARFVCVRNPYNPGAVTQYSLNPQVVDLIAFCTKNPAPMFPFLELLQPYGQYWFVTITPYGKDIEPNVPAKETVIESFQRLSGIVGTNAIGWRYDPILLTAQYTADWHIAVFETMAAALAGYTHTCVISFLDLYQKVRRNFPEAKTVPVAERHKIGREFARLGKQYGLTVKACAEGQDLAPLGVDCSGCMTAQTYQTALQCQLQIPKQKPARDQCACLLGNDIGAYDTCAHLCRYCYANTDAAAVQRNMRRHDPHSPFLTGSYQPGDVIHQATQKSWKIRQLQLFP